MAGKLTAEHIKSVRTTFTAYTYQKDITYATVAKQIGMSGSVISQWAGGTYAGDVDKVARTINNWMERDARSRGATIDVAFIPTKVAEEMQTIAKIAISHKKMAVIVVPSGAGKTMVMEVLSGEARGFYIYCDEDLTPSAFLNTLTKIVGRSQAPTKGTRAQLMDYLVNALKGTNRPIFLDEAHRLRKDVFPRIRTLHDRTNTAIIMAGTHEILEHIDDQANGRGQMASRCLRYNAMDYVYNAEDPSGGAKLGRPLFSRDEINKFLAELNIKLDIQAVDYAWALACLPGHGCLRTLKEVIDLIRERNKGKQISRNLMYEYTKLLFGQEGMRIITLANHHTQAMGKVG